MELLTEISAQTELEYNLLREDCALVEDPSVGLAKLTGEDRKSWLQGQATNDTRRMDNGASCGFCICEPTGQIVAVCDMWSVGSEFLITLPAATMSGLLGRAEDMVIMEDVVATNVSSEYRLISIQGPRATLELSHLLTLPSLDGGTADLADCSCYALRANRFGMGGWDLWIPRDADRAVSLLLEKFARAGEEAQAVARLEWGWPIFDSDYGRRTLPPELGPSFESKYVSYTKGCYTGQEVLMRLHSRGHTNKTWVGLIAEGAIASGCAVNHASRQDCGVVTSAALSPRFGPIGAATLRNEVARDGEKVTILTPSGLVGAEVRLMPLLQIES